MQGFWKGIESTHTFLHLKQLFLINKPAERCPMESCSLDAFEVKSLDHKKVFFSSPVTFLSRHPGKCFDLSFIYIYIFF